MNVQDYRAAGYALSQYIDQAAVSRAEGDVVAAYIAPALGHVPTADDLADTDVQKALMALSFLAIMQRTAVATRAGGKEKQTANSLSPVYEDVLRQNAPTAAMYLRNIAVDRKALKSVRDICGIFFRSQFFNR